MAKHEIMENLHAESAQFNDDYAEFADERGGYHAGVFDPDELPSHGANEASQTEVDEVFDDLVEVNFPEQVGQSMLRGAIERKGDWNVGEKLPSGSRHNHGRKPMAKK